MRHTLSKFICYAAIVSVLTFSGCKEEKKTIYYIQGLSKEYTLVDSVVFTYTDINNFMGYLAEDHEALDTLFAQVIFNHFNEGKFKIKDVEDNIISLEEAKSLLIQEKVILIPDSEEAGINKTRVERNMITMKDLVQFAVKEKWYWNEKALKIHKEITEIAPVVHSYDKDGDIRGKKILFWIILSPANES